jgi:DnaD/phage-associated family protein
MQIDESRKLLLSDTLVPDIFITELMPALSGLAVKVYLYLLMTSRNSRQTTEADLARRLGSDPDTIKAANLELAQNGLLIIHDRSLELTDIKASEIERIYRPRTSMPPAENAEADSRFAVREKLLKDIAKTFFQGLMAPSWYAEIESWFDRYHFEPEVIYALFQECSRRNKLNSKAYISRVAENWAARKIVTYEDLNNYFLAYDKVTKAVSKIGRKLRKTMTEYDEEIVARWIEQYQYDFDVIEIALRKTVRLANPNLEFIDRIIQEWFANQLKTVDQVMAYENAKAARLGAERSRAAAAAGNGASRRHNVGNFDQRDYATDFFDEFYANPQTVPASERPSEPASPEAVDAADTAGGPDLSD